MTFTDTMPARYTWTDIPKNNLISQINLSPTGLKINADKINVDTSSLDLTFGSQSSHVTIEATQADDGILFDGSGKVRFNTNGQFYVGNINTNGKLANNINLDGSSDYPYMRFVNYQKDNNATQYIASSIYLKQTSDFNSFDFYNNKKSSNTNLETATANHLAMFTWDSQSANSCRFDNYHWNGNLANNFYMESWSNASNIKIENRKSDGTVRTGLYMNSDGSFVITTTTSGTHRITMNPNGNLDVVGNNVVYLGTTNSNGYISIKTGGTQKDCYWDSDGYLRGR
jgi:hypothetical protein